MPSELTRRSAPHRPGRSTGPTTPEGKLRAAQNALRHGLSGKAPNPGRSGQIQSLTAALLAEDDSLSAFAASTIAEAMVRQEVVRLACDDAVERMLPGVDASLPDEVRRDLARAAALDKLVSLYDHDRRAAATLRKQLRRLG